MGSLDFLAWATDGFTVDAAVDSKRREPIFLNAWRRVGVMGIFSLIDMRREVHGNLPVEITGTNIVSDNASVQKMLPIAINLERVNDMVSKKGLIIIIVAVIRNYSFS
mmetsp:Transcript_378/g.420  ORF Transcript_378/g.420 Transcript_378/m.420 type:complete len:108 (-) Transcript_378:49-372(-)